jgi:hypothetical protein
LRKKNKKKKLPEGSTLPNSARCDVFPPPATAPARKKQKKVAFFLLLQELSSTLGSHFQPIEIHRHFAPAPANCTFFIKERG